MTKSDLIEILALRQRLPKGRAEALVSCVFESMENALRMGERIEIRGFGSFEIRNYKPYAGRNPRTGTLVQVKAKRLPFFKVGKELRERIDRNRRHEPTHPSKPHPVPRETDGERTHYGGEAYADEPS